MERIKIIVRSLVILLILAMNSIGFAATGSEIIGNVRVQILSPTLVRLEVRGPNGFEDRNTFHITNRNWPGAPYTRTTSGSTVLIQTADYIVRVPNSATSLSGITITKTDGTQIWAYTSLPGDDRAWLPAITENTQAWAIADNPRMVPASWGYNIAASGVPHYSTNGWDLTNNAPDMYVFLPKGDVRTLRSDLLNLTGRPELIPLYALGYWDSRWYPYTEQTALQQIDDYRNRDLPIDVLVIDTDWRVGGSTGYDINTALFPDMTRFMNSAHAKNVRIMFNDHPEPRASGLDPLEVTFRNNGMRSLFNRGLDIWWYDRNWSVALTPPAGNLQKEIWGMYIYNWITGDYYSNRRPIIMANTDGIDNGIRTKAPSYTAHRYTIQWTGDIGPDFGSLGREISNAVSNGVYAAIPYTSADLGGHTANPTDEGYIRWLQYGSMSPICRPHCTLNLTRMPWTFSATALDITRKYIKMRYRLLPMFYAAARKSYDTGDPILRRCDFDYPAYPEAASNDQYLLGDSILVAPVTASGTSRYLWIPPGNWIDVWSGNLVAGPVITKVNAPLAQMPIYIKPGTIVPLAPDMLYTGQKPWDPITLDVYPSSGRTANTSLYEDDGVSNDYKNNGFRTTQISAAVDNPNRRVTITINPAQGTFSGALANRSWVVRVHKPAEWANPIVSSVTINGVTAPYAVRNKDSAAMPFVNNGGSPDGNVVEVIVPSAAVSNSRNIVVSYSATGGNSSISTPVSTGIVSGQVYRLSPSHAPSQCLDVSGVGTADNTNVHIWSYVNGNNQKWQIIDVGGGYYKLIPQHATTKALDVSNAGKTNGTNVVIYNDNNTNAQKWRFIPTGEGYFYLEPACAPGSVLDVSGGGTGNGTNVQIWHNAFEAQQKWQLIPIGGGTTGVTFYQDVNYGGTASPLMAKGEYASLPSGIPNDWMSSLKIPSGWTVEVYADVNFGGTKWTFTADTPWVGSDCNDKMSSFKIY